MCRLFGALSTGELSADYWLRTAPQSLLMQSQVNPKRRQGDGWGMGWLEERRIRVFKSPKPIYDAFPSPSPSVPSGSTLSRRERDNLFPLPAGEGARRAGEGTWKFKSLRSCCLIAHVRWASNPLKLPREKLIGLEHTQPFQHGRWTFAHNGTLYIPREVAAELGPWKRFVKGQNDSEVLFYWLLKYLTASRVPGPASRVKMRTNGRTLGTRDSRPGTLFTGPETRDSGPGTLLPSSGTRDAAAVGVGAALRGLDQIWEKCKHRYPLYKYAYHGVNWVLTDGKILAAFCYVDPPGFDREKALAQKGQPYYQMQVHATKTQVIVASEPLDPALSWSPMKHGDLLIAQRQGKRISISRFQPR